MEGANIMTLENNIYLESLHNRSRHLIFYFWITWVFGLIIELAFKAPISFVITLFIGGIIVFGTIHIFILKKWLIFWIPYLIAFASYGLCYMMILANPHITTMVLFFYGITMLSFYHDTKPILLAYFLSSLISIFLFLTRKDMFVGYEVQQYATFLAILLIITGTMIGQSVIFNNSQRRLNEKNTEIENEKNHVLFIIDEINKSITSLSDFSKKFNQNIIDSKNRTNELSSQTNNLSNGAKKQTENIKDTNSLVFLLNQHLTTTDQSVHLVNQSNQNIYIQMTDSELRLKEMTLGLDDIQKSNSLVHRLFDDLNQSINEIESFTKVISDISTKSNLLALNAGIEAEQAGEHGKGFGVVAKEVKQLALNTKNSIDKIRNISQQIKSKSLETEKEILKSNHSIQTNIEITKQFENNFQTVHSNSQSSFDEIKKLRLLIDEFKNLSETFTSKTNNITSIIEENELNISEIQKGMQIQSQNASLLIQEYNDKILNQTTNLKQIAENKNK